MKKTDEERKLENDLLIGHLAEALEIIKAKCRRCENRVTTHATAQTNQSATLTGFSHARALARTREF